MTGENAYRLEEYRIAVYDDVLVKWERHVPLAMARSGRCFLHGNVLILGSASSDEDGFQIGEFHDKLRKLPAWTRTRFYCFAGDLFDTATGLKPADEILGQSALLLNRDRAGSWTAASAVPGAYRLGRYQVTAAADGSLSWQAHGDGDRLIEGPCRIESGILVMGHQERDEAGKNTQEFLNGLTGLKRWDKTVLWCRNDVLRSCVATERREEPGRSGRPPVIEQLPIVPVGTAPQREHREPVRLKAGLAGAGRLAESWKKALLSGLKALGSAWQRMHAAKTLFKWSIVFVSAMLLLGAAAAIYLAEKGHFWPHGSKKHHHDHHHDDH